MSRIHRSAVLLILLLMTVISYWPSYSAPFVYEDTNFVSENLAVRGEQNIQIRARFFSALVNWVNWRVAPSSGSFHRVNVVIHLVNGLLVYSIASVFGVSLMAFVAAFIFLLHPIQTEAVAYIAGRTELLSVFFVLLSLHLIVRQKCVGWGRALLILLCMGLAVSAKESAIVGFGLIALVLWYRRISLSYSLLGTCVVLGSLIALAISWTVFKNDFLARSDRDVFDYAAWQATAFWRYMGLVLWPAGFNIDHDFDILPRWVAGLSIIGIGVINYIWVLARGHGSRSMFIFSWAWVMIALSIRFVMRQPELLNEHQFYTAMVGISLLLASIVAPRPDEERVSYV